MASDTEKILGCLAGLAVGDAFGRPTELLFNYRRIEKKYGRVEDLVGKHPGAVTDDTRLSLTVADALIKKGAMITPDDLVDHWKREPEFRWRKFLKSFNRSEGFWFGEHVVAFAGKLGIPGHLTGYLNPSSLFAGNEAAMIMAPAGIYFRGNPVAAAEAGSSLAAACIVGAGTEVAGAWAGAIAAALSGDATVDSVVDAAAECSTSRVRPYFQRAVHVARKYNDVFSARDALLALCRQPFFVDSRETVPVALALFVISGGEPMKAIIGGANFGRDADTIAGMAGLLGGALKGIGAIEDGAYRKVVDVNGIDLESYAKKLAGLDRAP